MPWSHRALAPLADTWLCGPACLRPLTPTPTCARPSTPLPKPALSPALDAVLMHSVCLCALAPPSGSISLSSVHGASPTAWNAVRSALS